MHNTRNNCELNLNAIGNCEEFSAEIKINVKFKQFLNKHLLEWTTDRTILMLHSAQKQIILSV